MRSKNIRAHPERALGTHRSGKRIYTNMYGRATPRWTPTQERGEHWRERNPEIGTKRGCMRTNRAYFP
jgi:hypothetical protein